MTEANSANRPIQSASNIQTSNVYELNVYLSLYRTSEGKAYILRTGDILNLSPVTGCAGL
jgi:hypothetical protein